MNDKKIALEGKYLMEKGNLFHYMKKIIEMHKSDKVTLLKAFQIAKSSRLSFDSENTESVNAAITTAIGDNILLSAITEKALLKANFLIRSSTQYGHYMMPQARTMLILCIEMDNNGELIIVNPILDESTEESRLFDELVSKCVESAA